MLEAKCIKLLGNHVFGFCPTGALLTQEVCLYENSEDMLVFNFCPICGEAINKKME